MINDDISAAAPKSVLLWGGETTVTIPRDHAKHGEGGRNLTIAATALARVKDGEAILSLASDGRDHGPYAGAICDSRTRADIAAAGLDLASLLADNNTYALFERAGNYVMTGDTGSNV